MSNAQLRELFKMSSLAQEQDHCAEEKVICLYFKYASKNYCTGIDQVKEIIEFPLFVPYPVDLGPSIGVFNLRGMIIPIMDPDGYFMGLLNEFKGKAKSKFQSMKLRLILFESADGEVVGLPASEVGKSLASVEEFNSSLEFIKMNHTPYKKFDLQSLFEVVS